MRVNTAKAKSLKFTTIGKKCCVGCEIFVLKELLWQTISAHTKASVADAQNSKSLLTIMLKVTESVRDLRDLRFASLHLFVEKKVL